MEGEISVSPMLMKLTEKLYLLSPEQPEGHEMIGRQLRCLSLAIDDIFGLVLVAEENLDKISITREWLEKVEEAAYDADDLLDWISKVTNRGRSSRSRKSWGGISSHHRLTRVNFLLLLPADFLSTLAIEHVLMYKVKKMTRRLNGLSKKWSYLCVSEATETDTSYFRRYIQAHTSTHHGLAVREPLDEIIGRASEKETILKCLLIHENSNSQLTAISISGEDGIGKTTLARTVFDDPEVVKHFELLAFVSGAGNYFTAANIGKAIMESVTGMSCHLTHMDELDYLVTDTLELKRCLIVLDDADYLSEDICLHIIDRWFLEVAPGSNIIIVTQSTNPLCLENKFRKTRVAVRMLIQLPPLSPEDSWSLFKKQAFDDDESLPPLSSEDSLSLFKKQAFEDDVSLPPVAQRNTKIEAIAKELVAACRGIPLFLKLLGNLMRFQLTEAEWIGIQHRFQEINLSSFSHLPVFDNRYQPILFLCYQNLPSHLKQCLAHCSISVENSVLQKDKLIQMWIAEGLVHSTKGCLTEDTGIGYLKELLSRSFLMVVKTDVLGEVEECRLHDLVHAFARSLAGLPKVDLELPNAEGGGAVILQSRRFRRVSLAFDSASSTNIAQVPDSPNHMQALFHKFQGYRVLELSLGGLQKLPRHICTLYHLRYLDLSNTLIKRLPSRITDLKFLETLNLSKCSRLEKLPKGMYKLTELRHLDISSCHSLSHLPFGIGQLDSLRSLPLFVLGTSKRSAKLRELRCLNLRGKLEIKNLQNVRHIAEARGAKLYEKENLHHLGLSWGHLEDGNSMVSGDLVIESLWPHQNLKILDIAGYTGVTFPSWMRDSTIRNLVKLLITNCSCTELPPLGQLPYLTDLCITGMTSLQAIGPECYGDNSVITFPSTRTFQFARIC